MKAVNCMLDWLEFSVFEEKLEAVLYVLGIEALPFETKKGFYYSQMMVYDDSIYVSCGFKGKTDKSQVKDHIHVKITGRGCRFLEKFYEVSDLRAKVVERLDSFEIKVSRMDICIDYDSKFVLDYMQATFDKDLKGVRTTQIFGEKGNGMTLYLGSRNSDKFIRCYEKDHQMKDFQTYHDRVEIVLKDQYATFEFFNKSNLYKIISTYMNEITWNDDVLQEGWDEMKGELCNISPKIRHKKSTLEEVVNYVLDTYGAKLKAYAEEHGTQKISKAIHEAVLSEKDMRLIRNEKVLSMMKYRRKVLEKSAQDMEIYKQKTYGSEQLEISM